MMHREVDAVEVSVVVPVFNEQENLSALNGEITEVLAGSGVRAEVIWVDDGSTDGSSELLAGFGTRADSGGPAVKVITLRQNFGQTAALAAGIEHASGEVIVALDGDGQNDPADIPRLLAQLAQGFDVVSGWRRQRKDRGLSRRFPSWVANRLLAMTTGLRLHDYGCTLKAYRARAVKNLRLYGSMHRFIPAFLAARGARVAELEVNHRPRTAGVSKYGSERIVSVALDMVLLRFMTRYYDRPMQFFGHSAVIFGILATVLTALMVVFKYGWLRFVGLTYQASFVETPLPALVATLLVGALLSLFFGILGEVLIRVHHEAGDMKPYVIRSIRDSRDPGVVD